MTTETRWTQSGGAATRGARLWPPRTSRSSPETAQAPVGIRGFPSGPACRGWCSAHSAAPQEKSACVARIWPLRRQSIAAPRIAAVWLLVPEGHRRKLAGGKPAQAGAAPGCRAERAMPQRGIGEVFQAGRFRASQPPHVALGSPGRRRWSSIPRHFFDAPLGHGTTQHRFRGRRPRARTCPRLISSGVPPGREPAGHAPPKGNQRRGIRPELSKEDQETVAGLHEVGSRTGSRHGTAENMNEETLGHHGGAESSGGDAGGEGGE